MEYALMQIHIHSAMAKSSAAVISQVFSIIFRLTDKLNLNFSTGRYFQLPPYTALGYSNLSGRFINKQNNLRYISADHLVAGFELIPSENISVHS